MGRRRRARGRGRQSRHLHGPHPPRPGGAARPVCRLRAPGSLRPAAGPLCRARGDARRRAAGRRGPRPTLVYPHGPRAPPHPPGGCGSPPLGGGRVGIGLSWLKCWMSGWMPAAAPAAPAASAAASPNTPPGHRVDAGDKNVMTPPRCSTVRRRTVEAGTFERYCILVTIYPCGGIDNLPITGAL